MSAAIMFVENRSPNNYNVIVVGWHVSLNKYMQISLFFYVWNSLVIFFTP
jgi:hypothetical protein